MAHGNDETNYNLFAAGLAGNNGMPIRDENNNGRRNDTDLLNVLNLLTEQNRLLMQTI